MKYILYGFGGSYNHGGEAIIQTTCKMIRSIDKDATIVLSTHFKEQDVEFNLPVDKYCVRNMEEKETAKVYKQVIDEIEKDSIVMSVGGDNYCYNNWEKWVVIHDYAKSVGAKTVFWSCSIEPSMISDKMAAHLKTFDLITAREGKTFEALIAAGLTNVEKCYDVAFTLESHQIELPEGFEENNMIALNVSPLVLRRETKPGIILENITECVDYILEKTDYKIFLIPHVLMSVDNDVDALSMIKEYYKKEERVVFYNKNCSASQYKYLISKCRFGIFARTHASVAAYSSMVPTIVLGYSIKSIGIANDLEMDSYILPIEKLEDGQLQVCFEQILKEEVEVRKRLLSKEDTMIKSAIHGIEALKEIIG